MEAYAKLRERCECPSEAVAAIVASKCAIAKEYKTARDVVMMHDKYGAVCHETVARCVSSGNINEGVHFIQPLSAEVVDAGVNRAMLLAALHARDECGADPSWAIAQFFASYRCRMLTAGLAYLARLIPHERWREAFDVVNACSSGATYVDAAEFGEVLLLLNRAGESERTLHCWAWMKHTRAYFDSAARSAIIEAYYMKRDKTAVATEVEAVRAEGIPIHQQVQSSILLWCNESNNVEASTVWMREWAHVPPKHRIGLFVQYIPQCVNAGRADLLLCAIEEIESKLLPVAKDGELCVALEGLLYCDESNKDAKRIAAALCLHCVGLCATVTPTLMGLVASVSLVYGTSTTVEQIAGRIKQQRFTEQQINETLIAALQPLRPVHCQAAQTLVAEISRVFSDVRVGEEVRAALAVLKQCCGSNPEEVLDAVLSVNAPPSVSSLEGGQTAEPSRRGSRTVVRKSTMNAS